MNVRPLTERELETALIAILGELDAQGRHTCGDFYTSTFDVVDGMRVLPTNEGVFL